VEQCPQYPGKLTWWTDEKTAALIVRHNNIVDGAGEKRGCSALQAVSRADAEEPVLRVANEEDNYTVVWREFATFAEAKAYAPRVRQPKADADGFLLSALTNKAARLSYNDVMGVKTWKKTAGFCISDKLQVGGSTFTMYTCYRNSADKTTVVFVVGKLTRTV